MQKKKKIATTRATFMGKLVVIIAGVLSGLFLISGAGNTADPPKKLRIVYAEWGVGNAISYVGVDGGIFKKFNIDVEEIIIKDVLSGGIQALIGGDILIGFGNPQAVIQPILGGADLVLIGSHISAEKFGMCVSENIASLKYLKGKKIGVSSLGGRSDLAARVILRRAGLDPVNDVKIVVAGVSANRAAAITKDLIQGTPLNRDLTTQAKQLGLKIIETEDIPMTTSLLVTTRSFVKKNEELVRQFVKAYAVATHFYLSNRSESIEIIKKYFPKTDPQLMEVMYESFTSQLKPLPVFNQEALQAMIDVSGVIDQHASSLKPSQITEPRFLEELQDSDYMKQLYTKKVNL